MITLSEAIERMQNQLRLREAIKNYSQADLAMFLDDVAPQVVALACQHDIDRFIVRRTSEEIAPTVASLGGGKWRMRFDEPLLYVRRFSRLQTNEAIPISYVDPSQKYAFWAYFSPVGSSASSWTIVGEREILLNEDPTNLAFEISYVPKVPRQFSAPIAEASANADELIVSAKDVTLGALDVRKGTYAGMIVKVTSASEVAPEGEHAAVLSSEVTTYPKIKLTLERELSAAPAAGAEIESTLPFHDHGDDLLILEAVTRVLTAEGNEKRQAMVRGIKGEAHQIHSKTIPAQQDAARYVKYIPRI